MPVEVAGTVSTFGQQVGDNSSFRDVAYTCTWLPGPFLHVDTSRMHTATRRLLLCDT